MFQAYVITCIASGKQYIGITSRELRRRWIEHLSDSRRKPRANVLYKALQKYGSEGFTIEPICSARSWEDICAVEPILIQQWGTLVPDGFNLSPGGEGRGYGYRPSAESIEQSASKHRGRPCHPNTIAAGRAQRGRTNTPEHNGRIAEAKRGIARSEETKAKLRSYWARRRANGDFKTSQPYAHSKAASAMIAKIPYNLALHIARTYKP